MRYRSDMKFTLQDESEGNVVVSCSADRVVVRSRHASGDAPREQVLERSAILTPQVIVTDWAPRDCAALRVEDIRAVLDLKPELILLGTGERQQFPDARVAHAVLAAGVGFDAMDTRAACRTYNVLTQEGRRVAAALLIQ
jgi:uncharacterized protein